MQLDKFIEELARILEIQKEALGDNFNLTHCASWNSLAFLSVMAMVDRLYHVIIDGESLIKVTTIGELKLLLNKKVV